VDEADCDLFFTGHFDCRKANVVVIKRVIVATVLVAIVGAVALAQSSDPQVGTWKLNAGKSKGTMFQGGTVTVEPAGQGLKTSVDLVGQDGTPSKWSFTAQPDGKDYPIIGDNPFGNTLSVTRVDARTLKATIKQDGKVTVMQTVTVSEDGKTRTITSKGTSLKGQAIDSMTHYERQ
jgi:hypothetical protein